METKSILESKKRKITESDIINIQLIKDGIFEKFGVKFEEYDNRSRERLYIEPRQCFVFHCLKHTILTQDAIGEQFVKRGAFDHSTIISSNRAWDNLIYSSKKFAKISKYIDYKVENHGQVFTIEEILKAAEIGKIDIVNGERFSNLLIEAKQLMA